MDNKLAHLSDKMFSMWEGNHKFIAWWRHINKFHVDNLDWHIFVDCIVVDPRNSTALFPDAMINMN